MFPIPTFDIKDKLVQLRLIENFNFISDYTLPKTNIAPENCWLEDEFPFEKASFQVLC